MIWPPTSYPVRIARKYACKGLQRACSAVLQVLVGIILGLLLRAFHRPRS